MSFNAIQEYDAVTAGNNTDIGGVGIQENAPFANMNNALRELCRQVRVAVANQGSDIASAGTTNIGAATGQYVRVTGTTTITALGTVNAGTMRWVEFTGILTLTHNGTSLKLPGSANITTANGDVACFVSLGSGNWKCLDYLPVAGYLGTTGAQAITSTAAGTLLTLQSSDAGAGIGPSLLFDRASATPATNDAIGAFVFRGRDSGGNVADYGFLYATIADVTNGSEDGNIFFETMVAGASAVAISFGDGVRVGNNPTGGFKGAGALNAGAGLYIAGHGTIAQRVNDTEATLVTSGTATPFDDTIPQNTEGVEVLSVAITPTNASSVLYIDVDVQVGSSGTTTVTAALHQDAVANALHAKGESVDATTIRNIRFQHIVSAGSTSARTYKVNVGGASGTVSLNGINGASRRYGGVCVSSITVTEVLPQ